MQTSLSAKAKAAAKRAAKRPALAGTSLALAGLLSGCAFLTPTPPPAVATPAPPASLLDSWQAPLAHGGSPTDLVQWWARFNDPALLALQAAAQDASPSLAMARARVERARAAQVAAGAAGAPRLDAQGAASVGRNVPRQPTASSLSLGLQAQWELDLFGAVAAGKSAATARLEGAQALWHDARVAVAAETASSYTQLRACEAQLALAQLDATSRLETARLTDASATAGFTAPADAALARAGAAQARMLAVSQQAQCETQVKVLVELTDLPEPALRQRLAASTGVLPTPAPIAPAALPAALLAQRPDLMDAARAVVAAAGDTAQAQAREKPQVSLSGSFAGVSLRTSGGSNSQGNGANSGTTNGATWSLGPLVVNFPLFDGGSRAASTAAARASYDEAVALYRSQVRRAVREVETSLVALQSSAARQDDAASATRDFEASLRATSQRQQRGLASLFDLEAARRNAVQAQSALLELQRERVSAWISLYRALGGGWAGELLVPDASPARPVASAPLQR
jgi:outer membrane protein, multidrug efflux system